MSLNDRPIRIIKRKQHESSCDHAEIGHAQLKTETQTKRELIRIVASWIEERREKAELMWPRVF
jgi:hypothetical protein